ncbi:WD40 repeat protein [Salix suchowensis]|nr:WD40 repeat protein [Salix suchowensis]
MANHHARDGPRFATGESSSFLVWSNSRTSPVGAGPWSSRDNRSSDSSTERDYQNSDPSSYAHSNPPSNSNSRSIRERNDSPDTRLNGSIETSQRTWPAHGVLAGQAAFDLRKPISNSALVVKAPPWRGHSPGKLKTANAALVICLNIDVDPPDVVKTNPCAIMETWIDPHTMPSHKALEAIGTNLQHQFEGLSNKMVYKPILDPCFEDLSRFCRALRKSAKEDAVLFYYNGHGVPKPTASGELWCFNKSYTQYIPVSLSEVQTWLGSPGVYIWDCSAAGNLLTNFNIFAERRDREILSSNGIRTDGSVIQPYMSSVQLAACMSNETLPTCPELPADLFTSCLTAPIDTALRPSRWRYPEHGHAASWGSQRQTHTTGELNWIFTAITDTIAWTTFSRELFTRLYRCDLLIASLFRNFLLAERIMKSYGCTPHTYPPLPPTNTHNMWTAWDLALDTCIRQLPKLLNKQVDIPVSLTPTPAPAPFPTMSLGLRTGRVGSNPVNPDSSKPYTYVNNKFFTDQLKAFEVWISKGGSALTRRGVLDCLPQMTYRKT